MITEEGIYIATLFLERAQETADLPYLEADRK